MKRRKLSEDDLSVWRRVAETTSPLVQPRGGTDTDSVDEPIKQSQNKVGPHPVRAFQIGQTAKPVVTPHAFKPSPAETLSRAPVSMDRKSFAKMKRGKLRPEARIDLHGMTVAQAHPALNRFILSSQSAGRRLVLVITGKGREDRDDFGPIPVPKGVLRHQVPMWLAAPPLSQAVLQIAEAHVSHGGWGAYYVYLRKPR